MGEKVIKVFPHDGFPQGLRTIGVSNSTICGIFFPKTQLPEFAKLAEAQNPGVYLLLGKEIIAEGELNAIYIGEGDPVLPRLREHVVKKDFWEEAIVFTSTGDYFGKTQIQYLESYLCTLAQTAKQSLLLNRNTPQLPKISAPDEAEIKAFAKMLLDILLVMNIRVFDPRNTRLLRDAKGLKTFEYTTKQARATMTIQKDKYVIHKGSEAIVSETNSISSGVKKMRQNLLKDGLLTISLTNKNKYFFIDNITFTSSSYAADVVSGSSISGPQVWKRITDGKKLKEVLSEID